MTQYKTKKCVHLSVHLCLVGDGDTDLKTEREIICSQLSLPVTCHISAFVFLGFSSVANATRLCGSVCTEEASFRYLRSFPVVW